jgi:hypothetical protein
MGKKHSKKISLIYLIVFTTLKQKNFSEKDFGFCKRWTEMGGKVYVYILDYITHVGEYQYCG